MPQTFEEFWNEVVHVWIHGLYGVDIGNIVSALLILLAFLVFRGLLSRYILAKLHEWAAKTSTKLDDNIAEAMIPPIKFIPVVMGIFFAGKFLALPDQLDIFFANVVRSLIAFTLFWALYRSVDPFRKLFKRLDKILSRAMVDWMFKAMKVFVLLIGAAVILETWGIQVAPLLAGFGLLGVAVALGAQDLFKNLIAGLTVIAEKRFSPGDWIQVEGVVEGTVEDIGFRSTKIRRFDQAPVHVPNAQLADTVVVNFSRMPFRRINWLITISDSATTQQLKLIRDGIKNFITSNKDLFATPEEASTMVHLDSIGDHSLDITINCFTRAIGGNAYFAAKEQLAFAIKEVVEDKAGASFASPTQNIVVKGWQGEIPESFEVPKEKKKIASAKK